MGAGGLGSVGRPPLPLFGLKGGRNKIGGWKKGGGGRGKRCLKRGSRRKEGRRERGREGSAVTQLTADDENDVVVEPFIARGDDPRLVVLELCCLAVHQRRHWALRRLNRS